MAVRVNYLSTLAYFSLYPILTDKLRRVSDLFYYYSNNNLNGEISTEVCQREYVYLSGDFGCFSSSDFSCVGTCERRTQGYFEVIKDEPGQSGYFWNMVKLNVSIPF